MNKNMLSKLILTIIIALTGLIAYSIFYTRFAELTVDYFAFFAGIFLAADGTYKILHSKAPFYPDQLLRAIRIIIGTSVFTIHLLQFLR